MHLKSHLMLGEIVDLSKGARDTDLAELTGETDLANDRLVCFAG